MDVHGGYKPTYLWRACCMLVGGSIDACSIGKIISTLPDAARHRETREIQSVPRLSWLLGSTTRGDETQYRFFLAHDHSLDVSMGQSSSDYQISRLRTNFGGSLGVETKLWLKAWDWRRWMQVQPLVSDSDGLWVSKKFRPLRNHRKPQVRTAWTAATHSGLFLTFMTFANFVPSHLWVRARLLSQVPRVQARMNSRARHLFWRMNHVPTSAKDSPHWTNRCILSCFGLGINRHREHPSGHFPMVFFDATFPAALPPSSSLRCSEVQWIWLQTIGLSRDHPIQISMKTDVNVARSSRLQPSLSLPKKHQKSIYDTMEKPLEIHHRYHSHGKSTIYRWFSHAQTKGGVPVSHCHSFWRVYQWNWLVALLLPRHMQ